MTHVFISYSHADDEKAFLVERYLQRGGLETCIDDSIVEPGDKWRERLLDALNEAFAVVVICTQKSMASHEVTFEWSYAMGMGVEVIPLVYESDCQLHSRLNVLQHLDFTDPDVRKRPWDKLVASLVHARDKYRPTIGYLRDAGISRIFFSRSELEKSYPLSDMLQQVRANTEFLVVARSCEAWARQYEQLQSLINDLSISIKLAMVNPDLPKDQWMIKKDYAQLDVTVTQEKLGFIQIEPASKGSVQLALLPNSPLFSFVHFIHKDGHRIGILEAGASLQLNERTIIMLRSDKAEEGLMLQRIYKIYSRVFESGTVVFKLSAAQAGLEKGRDDG